MKLTKLNFSKRKLPKSKNINNYVNYQVTIKSLKERTKDKRTRMILSVIKQLTDSRIENSNFSYKIFAVFNGLYSMFYSVILHPKLQLTKLPLLYILIIKI